MSLLSMPHNRCLEASAALSLLPRMHSQRSQGKRHMRKDEEENREDERATESRGTAGSVKERTRREKRPKRTKVYFSSSERVQLSMPNPRYFQFCHHFHSVTGYHAVHIHIADHRLTCRYPPIPPHVYSSSCITKHGPSLRGRGCRKILSCLSALNSTETLLTDIKDLGSH
jgi:hypothetical protein